jgi:transposase
MSDHRFKEYDPDQLLLLPPDLKTWLPENHLAWFVSDMVDSLNLSEIEGHYDHLKGGKPGFHPSMMVKLLVYAYCVGVPSSRQIEKKTYEDVAFRVLAAGYHPDHSAIAKFRSRHIRALSHLFTAVLWIADEMGLVKLGHVAIDGTKVKANASKHKSMSYGRMDPRLRELKAEVDDLLKRARSVDKAEDKEYGKGVRGDELPREIELRENRIAKIVAAQAALEERKRQELRESGKIDDDDIPPGASSGEVKSSEAVPEAKAQINFTDPESRIMKDNRSKSFEQAYNAQLAVDCGTQIIVSADVTQQVNDKRQLVPLLEQIEANTGQVPDCALADSGYFSTENVESCERNFIEPFICRNRIKHSDRLAVAPKGRIPKALDAVERMCRKLLTKAGKKTYSKRKESVEAVIGQIKHVRGFRQFLLRGLEKVKAEWRLICLSHNLLKMWRSGRSLPAFA